MPVKTLGWKCISLGAKSQSGSIHRPCICFSLLLLPSSLPPLFLGAFTLNFPLPGIPFFLMLTQCFLLTSGTHSNTSFSVSPSLALYLKLPPPPSPCPCITFLHNTYYHLISYIFHLFILFIVTPPAFCHWDSNLCFSHCCTPSTQNII